MLGFTIKKAAGLAIIFAAASLAIAAPANATYFLSPDPTINIFADTYCAGNGQMFPTFWADGANLDQYKVETQRIYVQLGMYSRATGFVADSTYYFGDSKGFDISTASQMDHVQRWYDAYTGQELNPSGYLKLGIYNRGHGTYQVWMRFAWDTSSSGASSSRSFFATGWTGWYGARGTCTY